MGVVVAIDAGGTSTEVLAFPDDSDLTQPRANIEALKETSLSSGNFATIGVSGMRDLANEAFEFASQSFNISDDVSIQLLAGVAGIETEELRATCASVFERAGFTSPIILNDCELLIEAQGGNGVAIIAGTGSNCFGRNKGKFSQDGGWGPILGDQGSGFQIGQLACFAAIEFATGRYDAQDTSLLSAILSELDTDDLRQLISFVYANATGQTSSAAIASFAPLVFAAAEEGDKVAANIIALSASEFAKQVANVCRKIGLNEPLIGQQGGIFRNAGYERFYHPHLVNGLAERGIAPSFRRFGTGAGEIDPLLGAVRTVLAKNG